MMTHQVVLAISLLLCVSVVALPNFCSFDNDLCGYMNIESSEGTDWERRSNVTGFSVRDHTSGNGFFLYASYGWSDREPIGQLISPGMRDVGCIQFYYYRTFRSVGILNVLTKISGKVSLVWTVESIDSTGWKFASIPISTQRNELIKIIFQAVIHPDYVNGKTNELSTLIDDIKITSDSRSCKLYPAQPVDRIFKEGQGRCNFDLSMCGYQRNLGRNTWRRYKGWRGGPLHDHTFKSGRYMSTSVFGLKQGTRSQMISPILTNVQCITFYYYMQGKHAGELNVYTKTQNKLSRALKLSGNYGNLWKKATIFVDTLPPNTPFQLVFESVKGDGDGGKMAIDDISTSTNCRRPQTKTSKQTGNEVSIRLVQDDTYYVRTKNEGRVEILYNGKWGTICDNSWSIEDATVVCKMLGFPAAEKAVSSSGFGSGSGDIWLSNVQCTGAEKSISECKHAGWGTNQCLHSKDAGVVCQTGIDANYIPQYGSCKFENNLCGYTIKGNDQGPAAAWTQAKEDRMLEIITSSSVKAGTVTTLSSPILPSSTKCFTFDYLMCDYERENLGAGTDIGILNVYLKSTVSNALTKIWTLTGVHCVEFESGSVQLNAKSGEKFQVVLEYVFGKHSKVDILISSIIMLNRTCRLFPFNALPEASGVKLRLSDGKTNMEGRVEIFYDGIWGTVRDRGWTLGIATVACRQLQFAGVVGVYHRSAFGHAIVNGSVWNPDPGFACIGNEAGIAKCIKENRMRSVPSSDSDAGVECFDARLVGGNSPNEGRVEINYKGKWGTICNKGWNMKSANVICRDLGYQRAKALKFFGQGQGEIRLSNVRCTGDEVSIAMCSYRGWIVDANCDHSQDLGVVCINDN